MNESVMMVPTRRSAAGAAAVVARAGAAAAADAEASSSTETTSSSSSPASSSSSPSSQAPQEELLSALAAAVGTTTTVSYYASDVIPRTTTAATAASATSSTSPSTRGDDSNRRRRRRIRRRRRRSSIAGIVVKSDHVGMDISGQDDDVDGDNENEDGFLDTYDDDDEHDERVEEIEEDSIGASDDPMDEEGRTMLFHNRVTSDHHMRDFDHEGGGCSLPPTAPAQSLGPNSVDDRDNTIDATTPMRLSQQRLPQHTSRDVTDESEGSDRSSKAVPSRQQQQQQQLLANKISNSSSYCAAAAAPPPPTLSTMHSDQQDSAPAAEQKNESSAVLASTTEAKTNGDGASLSSSVRLTSKADSDMEGICRVGSDAHQQRYQQQQDQKSTDEGEEEEQGRRHVETKQREVEPASTSEAAGKQRRVKWGSTEHVDETDEMSSSTSPSNDGSNRSSGEKRQRDVQRDGGCGGDGYGEMNEDEDAENEFSKGDDEEGQSQGTTTMTTTKPPAVATAPPKVEPLDINYTSTPSSLRLKDELLHRLSLTASMGRIQVIDLSRRGLTDEDAELISATMRTNAQLAVLKLGYNSIGDNGAAIIASSASTNGRHHQSLTVLDLGFNDIGDEGCTALSINMLAGNHTLRNLFLSGNQITDKGATALAGAILHGCSLSRLHLSANKLGTSGIKVLAQAIAEAESRVQNLLQRQGGIKLGYTIKPVTMEELHVSDVDFDADGCATISSMIMTNFNLTTLALANNNIDDKDMALLSQALAQNKTIPVKSLVLSFNNITCIGVECLMNAIWGSPTMREIKLDNNKMQDRGAQLCSVVLGSINLEVLDVSFNLITTVGIKAIMKSLSENSSLQRLGLSGIPVDQNASKAVSYALAYNQSLLGLNIDSCNIGYSGQRHIVAGVVSNRNVKLRTLTGFPLGPITMTLGLPQLPEDWGNDRVLSFIRFMWAQWRAVNVNGSEIARELSRGPAPPSMVASSAKTAFGSLSQSDEAKLLFQSEHQSLTDECPMVEPDTAILVRSPSGQNLQVPSWDVHLRQPTTETSEDHDGHDSWSSESDSFDRSSYTGSSCASLMNVATVDHERRNKNLLWLRSHIQSLNELGNLEFNNADLWQLHQYFYSPAYSAEDDPDIENSESVDDPGDESTTTSSKKTPSSKSVASPSTPNPIESEVGKAGIGRAISFQTLGKAVAKIVDDESKRPNKRGSLAEHQPTAKRPKHLKPRIAFYPRIQEKLESLGTKPSAQTLSLLRRLKYVESVMLRGKDIYSDHDPSSEDENKSEEDDDDDDSFGASDAEMVLLDLL